MAHRANAQWCLSEHAAAIWHVQRGKSATGTCEATVPATLIVLAHPFPLEICHRVCHQFVREREDRPKVSARTSLRMVITVAYNARNIRRSYYVCSRLWTRSVISVRAGAARSHVRATPSG